MKTVITLLFSFLLGLTFLIGCKEEVKLRASGKKVKIGLIAPLSGPSGEWGKSGLKGIQTALAMQPYLLNGDQVELVLADDLNTPALTREAMIELVKEEQVAAILLFSDSSAALEAVKLADSLKTPILLLLATHPGLTRSDWVSQFVFDDITQGTVAALFVRDELLVDNVAVFRDPLDPHSVMLAEQFSRKFTNAGGAVHPVELNKWDIDIAGIAKELKASRVEFLYVPLEADKVIKIERAAREIPWDVGVMVSDGLLSQITLHHRDDLDAVEGMLATDLYSSDLPRTEYGNMAIRTFRDLFGKDATTFSAIGCEGTSVLLSAMDKCGKSDSHSCINKMLRSDVEFSGLFGQIRSRENGKVERPIFINKIENSKLRSVVKVY